MNDVIIIHFRPVALYPPVINLVRFFSEQKKMNVALCTTSAKAAPNFSSEVKLIVPKTMDVKYFRWFVTIRFYFLAFGQILSNKRAPVIYFESLSSFPVWLYLLLIRSSQRKMMAHFHEYFSEKEYRTQSSLERFGRNLEKRIFTKLSWISHTNSDRLSLFLQEFPYLQTERLHVSQNFPPSSWVTDSVSSVNKPLKLVYVGSLSFDNIYTREFVEWIVEKRGMITCDFYSLNAGKELKEFFSEQPDDLVKFKGAILYDDLPSVLPLYQVGIIMYKGISNNVICSAPNKMFEYLACGLDVWCSVELISSRPFAQTESYPKVILIDFNRLDHFDYLKAIDRTGLEYKPSPYTMESVYDELYKHIVGR